MNDIIKIWNVIIRKGSLARTWVAMLNLGGGPRGGALYELTNCTNV